MSQLNLHYSTRLHPLPDHKAFIVQARALINDNFPTTAVLTLIVIIQHNALQFVLC